MSETPSTPAPDAPGALDSQPVAPVDQSARIAELEAQLAAAQATDNVAPDPGDPVEAAADVKDAPLPAEAANAPTADSGDDEENGSWIVTHSGERMLVDEYRKTKEFIENFVKPKDS